MLYRNLQSLILLLMILMPTQVVVAQDLKLPILQELINSHPDHDSKLSKSIKGYLDTCTLKNNFSTEEFLQFISESKSTIPFRLLDTDMQSVCRNIGFYLSYSSTNWYKGNYDLFLNDQINQYLLFTKTRKEQETKKPCKLRFGYFIFEKDKTIYCLMRIVEI